MNNKTIITKQCTKCNKTQPLSNFHKSSANKYGYNSVCKDCRSNQMKVYRENNLEKCLNASRNFRKNNKDYWNNYYHKHKND